MKKALVTLLILGLLGGAGYGAYYFYFQKQDEAAGRVSSSSADAIHVEQVSVITGYGSGNGMIERYGGKVEPQATLGIKLENDKTVKKCYVKEGDQVKEGDKLFTYDTTEEEDKKAQDEIDIEKAEGDIELAEKGIEQAEKSKKNAKEDELLDIQNTILTEQNNIKRAEYEIKTKQLEIAQAEETIKESTVKAELTGTIQKITDTTSDMSGNESDYITIMADGDFRIKGKVNEANYLNGQLFEGMRILAYSRVDSTKIWSGVVTEVKTDTMNEEEQNTYSWNGNPGSTNYDFFVELEDSEGLILGQHVYMEEDRGQTEQKQGLWLEYYYIVDADTDPYVWIANEKNLIEKRTVELGEYDEDLMKYEILSGLSAEDYIANPLNAKITEGEAVIYDDYSIPSEDGFDMDGQDFGEDFEEFDLDEGFGTDDVWEEDPAEFEDLDVEAPENLAVGADEFMFDEFSEDQGYEEGVVTDEDFEFTDEDFVEEDVEYDFGDEGFDDADFDDAEFDVEDGEVFEDSDVFYDADLGKDVKMK